MKLQERSRGCFIGLAVGDALGGPTENKTPDEIRSRWGTINDFLSDDQAGSDDTEYALFNAKLLIEKGTDLTSDDFAAAWRKEIIRSDNIYKGAGFSEIIAINNLKKNLNPPMTGKHMQSWSDGLAMRCAPFGIAAAGDPDLAARLAEADGAVSHSGEGVFAGKAVAAAVASAMGGDSPDKIFNTALGMVPEDSWTFHAVNEGITIGSQAGNVKDALRELYFKVAHRYYFWPDLAPEAAGLAFGIIAASRGKFKDAVIGAVNIGRDTDTIAAIAGAVCGAMEGIESIPMQWVKRISVSKGTCISAVRDMNILDTADALAKIALSRSKFHG